MDLGLSPHRARPWSRRDCLRALATSGLLGWAGRGGASALAREPRAVSPFHAVELDGVGELAIVQGGSESLAIEAEPALLPRLSARVRDGVLRFDYGPGDFVTRAPVRFLLGIRTLEQLALHGSGSCLIARLATPRLHADLSGSGNLSIAHLTADELVVRLSGSGSMKVAGTVLRQSVDISGAADYLGGALQCRDAQARISGAGHIALRVSGRLEADISGSGEIRYLGSPVVHQRIDGAGAVLSLRYEHD